MYRVNDKKEAVRQLQTFLFALSERGDIPHLAIDGIFSEETKRSVSEFQRQNSLFPSGKADKTTFDLIYKEYIDYTKSKKIREGTSAFPLKIADKGTEVARLSTLLYELSEYYTDIEVEISDFLSPTLYRNAEKMLSILGSETKDGINEKNISILNRELKERRKFKRNTR